MQLWAWNQGVMTNQQERRRFHDDCLQWAPVTHWSADSPGEFQQDHTLWPGLPHHRAPPMLIFGLQVLNPMMHWWMRMRMRMRMMRMMMMHGWWCYIHCGLTTNHNWKKSCSTWCQIAIDCQQSQLSLKMSNMMFWILYPAWMCCLMVCSVTQFNVSRSEHGILWDSLFLAASTGMIDVFYGFLRLSLMGVYFPCIFLSFVSPLQIKRKCRRPTETTEEP